MKIERIAIIVAACAAVCACTTTHDKPPQSPTQVTAPAAANIAGTWRMDIASPAGDANGKLIVVQDNTAITGTLETPHGNVAITGMVGAKDVNFTTAKLPGIDAAFTFSGTIENGTMKGKAKFEQFGEGIWQAAPRGK